MVRMARRRSGCGAAGFPATVVAVAGELSPTDSAMTASATASSSLDGSKMTLAPTATTRSVTDGRGMAWALPLRG